MIKATMICTNCRKETVIPYDELSEAVDLDKQGELNLCSVCKVVWVDEVDKLREARNTGFAELQKRFGIGKEIKDTN